MQLNMEVARRISSALIVELSSSETKDEERSGVFGQAPLS
jgi:hypothetical protein